MSGSWKHWLSILVVGAGCRGTIGGVDDDDATGVKVDVVAPVNADTSTGPTPDPTTGTPRSARRLSAPQLRHALIAATGFDYLGRAQVADPASPQGSVVLDDAPLLEVYGASLGNPDYNYTTAPSLDASITFSKLAEDAVRHTCARLAEAEVVDGQHPSGEPHLLLTVSVESRWPEDEAAIRENIAGLALRFWGQVQPPDSEDTTALLDLFRVGYAATNAGEGVGGQGDQGDPGGGGAAPTTDPPGAGRTASAWRTVCIGMLSDPRFLTY